MMNDSFSEIPSEMDFLGSLGVEPTISNSSDGFWSYRFESDSDINLVLSFDQHAGSIQTCLLIGERELSTVSHEGLVSLKIETFGKETRLVGHCRSKGEVTEIVVTVYPAICVVWASLRSE